MKYDVEIKGYVPVLDALVPVVRKMVRNKKINVLTSMQPEMVGLVLDVEKALVVFSTDVNVTFYTRYVDGPIGNSYWGDKFEKRYQVNFFMDENMRFDVSPHDDLKGRSSIDTKTDSLGPISVIAKSMKVYKTSSPSGGLFQQIAQHSNERLPKAVKKMEVSFSCLPKRNFSVNAIFQDQAPINERLIGNRNVSFYLVSKKSEHILDKEGYDFFLNPVLWDGLGSYYATRLGAMAGLNEGRDTGEDYISDGLKRYIDAADKFCYKVIEDDVASKKSNRRSSFVGACNFIGTYSPNVSSPG